MYACNGYIYGISSEMARERGTENDIASLLHVLSLSTALKFLFLDLHACLHVPKHGPLTNTTTQQNF